MSVNTSRPGQKLSELQLRVLSLIADGLITKEIATRLELNEHTVKYHTHCLMIKLRARNRAHAAAMFVRMEKAA